MPTRELLPHSLAAERALLGALILNSDSYWKFGYKLEPEMFFTPTHVAIFKSLKKLYQINDVVDVVSLADALRTSSELKDIGGTPYLLTLIEDLTTVASVKQHVGIVVEKYKLRELYKTCVEATGNIALDKSTADEIKEDVERGINNLFINKESDKPKSTKIEEFIVDIEELRKSGGIRGPHWFLAQIDDCTGGVLPGYWVLSGTKKSGKTKLACQQLNTNIRNDIKTLYISMEPRFSDVAVNLISLRHHINNKIFNRASELQDSNIMVKIRQEASKLKEEPFDVKFMVGPTYDEIISLMRREYHINGYRFFIIDYLQLIDPGYSEGRTMAGMITRGVNQIAYATAEMNIHVLALSQLSHMAEREKAPHIGHIKDSGGIAEAAMGIMLIQNYKRSQVKDREIQDKAERRQVDIIIPALRHGESPKVIETQEQFEYSRVIPGDWVMSAYSGKQEEEVEDMF